MYSFKKAERLKSKKTIDLLFSEGSAATEFPVKMVWVEANFNEPGLFAKATFSVSKRKHAKAVVRNRIKRLMREAYRLNKHKLYSNLERNKKSLALMFIFSGNKPPAYSDVEGKIIKLLNRLALELDAKTH